MGDFDPLYVDIPRLLTALGISAEHDGDRWVARCPHPEHFDKNPSWDIKDTVGQSRHGLHHCLSCKWEGTSSELVADLIGISFQGARDWISERAMGTASVIRSVAVNVNVSGRVFHLPPECCMVPLNEWPEVPRRYVTGPKRRITPAQVKRWHLGYAVKGHLSGRIIIPANDALGVLQSYTARTFAGSPKRYLNPKKAETPLPGAIFGEEHWPDPQDRNVVVVTEGAFNALAAERVAPSLPIASLFGSNVENRHLSKVSTFKAVLLLTDPDAAGDRAAEKLDILASRIRMARVQLETPEGWDEERDGKVDANSIEPAVLRQALVDAWRSLK